MTDTIRKTFAALYGRAPEVVAYAPGRIEFIGNHTDYNGGPVLGAAINRGTWVALARREDGQRQLASDWQAGSARFEIFPGLLERQGGRSAWTNYPMGVIKVLPSFGFCIPDGFDFLAISNLPSGAGLSSSAALELASASAFLAVNVQQCPLDVLAMIGRKAENDYVGVPCGILDQGVSAFGQADHLVYIDCRKMNFSSVRLPSEASFWVFNTNTKHALVDGLYAERHRECMQAATEIGVGLLADATVAQLATAIGRMPAPTMKRARHVLEEIARVEEVVALLAAGRVDQVGCLLTASHRSSQYLFENSTRELDLLVDNLVEVPGVYGARLTGGGFGGAVLALTGPSFGEREAVAVAKCCARHCGGEPDIMHLHTGNGARVITARRGSQ